MITYYHLTYNPPNQKKKIIITYILLLADLFLSYFCIYPSIYVTNCPCQIYINCMNYIDYMNCMNCISCINCMNYINCIYVHTYIIVKYSLYLIIAPKLVDLKVSGRKIIRALLIFFGVLLLQFLQTLVTQNIFRGVMKSPIDLLIPCAL